MQCSDRCAGTRALLQLRHFYSRYAQYQVKHLPVASVNSVSVLILRGKLILRSGLRLTLIRFLPCLPSELGCAESAYM